MDRRFPFRAAIGVLLLAQVLGQFHGGHHGGGGDHNQNSFQCLSCNGQRDKNSCRHETCHYARDCFMRAVQDHDGIKYYSGCVSSRDCYHGRLTTHNPHYGRQVCGVCCGNSRCNDHSCPEQHHEYHAYPCLSCDDVPTLEDCTKHESCDADHTCHVRRVESGSTVRFWGGCVRDHDCRHSQLISSNNHQGFNQTCGLCCHGDNCNRDLCTDRAYKPYSCLSCHSDDSLKDCTHEETCSEHQLCAVREVQFSDRVRFYGGCVSKDHDCHNNTLTTNNQHGGTQKCAKCCSGDNCNRDLCSASTNSGPTHTTPTNPTTSTSATTITTTNTNAYRPYSCLTCYGDNPLQDCPLEETCSEDQLCAVREVQFSGTRRYYGGCVNKEQECHNDNLISPNPHGGTQRCAKCCSGDNCNRYLCFENSNNVTTTVQSHATRPTHSTSRHYCATCYGESSHEHCTGVEECLPDEMCTVLVIEDTHHKPMFFAGCQHRDKCTDYLRHAQQFVDGRKVCGNCCVGDLCNVDICAHWSRATNPPASSTASHTTQSHHAVTTAPPPTTAAPLPTTTVPPTTAAPLPTTTEPSTTTTTTTTTTTPTTTTTTVRTTTRTTTASVTYSPSDKFKVFECLSCYNVSSLDDCHDTDPCHSNQMCSVNVVEYGRKRKYFGGCVPDYECENNHLITNYDGGRRLCSECCKGESCNKGLCVQYIHDITTPPTAGTTTTTTTEAPTTTVKQKQIKCNVCDGPLCGLIPGNDPLQLCPQEQPYCMNTVENHELGDKVFKKRCASKHECETKWWDESSDKTECTDFDIMVPYYFPFTCSYCCIEDGCNTNVFPAQGTLYQGKS